MRKDYELPKKQYGVCPICGLTVNTTREKEPYHEMRCDNCGTIWEAKFTYGYEDMIISAVDLSNKDKKKQKEEIIIKYETLREDIRNTSMIEDLEARHFALSNLDQEFKLLCPKKYNAYFEMGSFKPEYDPNAYAGYLKNRSFKMIRDINKILFYFGR